MNVSFEKLIHDFPIGTVFKSIGHSGVTYFGETGEGILILSCPQKGYRGRRLRYESVGFQIIEIPKNDKQKRRAFDAIGR